MANHLNGKQGVDLKLNSRRVKVLKVQDLSVREATSDHAALHGRLRVEGTLADALTVVGRSIQARAFDGQKFQPLFRGIVDEIDYTDSSLTFSAVGPTHERDETVHTRTFGEADRPMLVHKLPGIGEALSGVRNTARLTSQVPLAWQFGTDFALLRRLADLHGLLLLPSAHKNEIALTDGTDGPKMMIPAEWIMPGSEQLTVRRRTVADAHCLTWNVLRGDMPSAPGKPHPANVAESMFADLLKSATTAGAANSVVHAASFGGMANDNDLATLLARACRAMLIRYRATLSYHGRNVAVGSRIRFVNHPLVDELFVYRRWLRYWPDAASTEAQFTNEIECTLCVSPPLGAIVPWPNAPTMLLGRVVDLADPLSLARIKVACPWHGATGRAGIWAFMPQPFGGNVEDRHAGVANLPGVGDWVVALADINGFDPLIVLGSIYPGDSSGSKAKKKNKPPSPLRERVLFRTGSGAELVVLEAHDGQSMAVTLGIRNSDGSDCCRVRLCADGKVDLQGSDLRIRSKSLLIESQGLVKGSLNVTKE